MERFSPPSAPSSPLHPHRILTTLAALWSCAKLKADEKIRGGLIYLLPEYALRFAALFPLLALWQSIYQTGGADDFGFSLNQLLLYTLLSSALQDQLVVRSPASNWLYEGLFISLFQRPLGIFSQLIALTMGSWVPNLLFYTIPLLLVSPLLGVSLASISPLFWPSFLLCIAVGFAIDLLFATLLIRMQQNSWLITVIRRAIVGLFSGSIIPFAAFPFDLGQWLQYSPFGALAGAPLAIAVGSPNAATLILCQIAWLFLLWPLALAYYHSSRERMMSYGG